MHATYIIDTGIRASHQEFAGRIVPGFDAVTAGGSANDCNGHGTHGAGTVGGTVYGVAKQARRSPIRVLDCSGSGTWAGVIAGMDWVAANRVLPAVADMSLGGGASAAADEAVGRLVASGVATIVAAGNSGADACFYSPAGAPASYTVGATTNTDAMVSWSNYGNCVDVFAPGVNITSAWHTSNTAIHTISGTSMASPHVAGAAALYLETAPAATPSQVYAALTQYSTKNIVTSALSTNNHLLYSLFEGGGGAPPPPPPPPPPGEPLVADFRYQCRNSSSCSFTDASSGGPTGWSWTFPNASPAQSNLQHPSTNFLTAGDHTVLLTVSRNGETSTASRTISCRDHQIHGLRCR